MDKKLLMSIRIEINGPALHMKGENAEVLMIPFQGSVESELFTGIVEPCGVDTQIVNAAGVRHLSARYMLTGKDCEGKDAHIYIENNGWIDAAAEPGPFRALPTIYTDSAALAPILHRSCLTAEGSDQGQGLHIDIYEIG